MGLGTIIAGAFGGVSLSAVLAALFPAPHVVSAAGATQTLTFDVGARETTWDVTMAANTAFTIDTTNMVVGSSLKLILRQDSTAGRTPTLPPKAAWPNGSVPTTNAAAGKHDVFFFDSDDGVKIDGSVRTLAALPPSVPSAPSVSAAPGTGQVALTITDGAANGAPITSRNIYRSTASGAETLVASGVTSTTYTDSTVINGTPYFYQATDVNGVGESARSAEITVTPVAASAHYAVLPGTSGQNLSTTGSTSPQYHVTVQTVVLNMPAPTAPIEISNSTSGRCLLYILQNGQVDYQYTNDGGGAATFGGSPNSIPSNAFGSKLWLRVGFNCTSKAASANGLTIPAYTLTYEYSLDGTTFTSLGTNSVSNGNGAGNTGYQIGAGSVIASPALQANVYAASIYDATDAKYLLNVDFTAQASGATSFTGSAGNAWTVTAPASIH